MNWEPLNKLKQIRLFDKKISQFELSRRSRVHPSRISLIENGLTMPTLNEQERIARALGMTAKEIFDNKKTSIATGGRG
jgi:transcriptional regulator with XRE-family HTH domain